MDNPVYGEVPPDKLTLICPLQLPSQLSFLNKPVIVYCKSPGLVILKLLFALQPLVSKIVTEYVPACKSKILSLVELKPLGPYHW